MAMAIFQAVYTDGACKKNGTALATGGIGVYWGKDDARNVSARVHAVPVTNNICELLAIDVALEGILKTSPDGTRYVLFSDSKYAIACVTTWYDGFVARGWLSTAGSPVKNKDLILSVREKCARLGPNLTMRYVKAHRGDVGNEAADKLAVAGCSLP